MVWLRDPRDAANLDEIIRELGMATNPEGKLFWSAIFELPKPGWEPAEQILTRGDNWLVIFDFGEHSYAEFDTESDKIVPVPIRAPSVLVGVRLEELSTDSLKAARRQHRALMAILSTQFDAVLFGRRVWENFLEVTPDAKMRFLTTRRRANWQVSKDEIESRLSNIQPVSLAGASEEASRAANWYGRAIEEESMEARFTCLWLGILCLVDGWAAKNMDPPSEGDQSCCTTSGDWSVRRKMREYVKVRLGLQGPEEKETFGQLDTVYGLRHRLLKGASDSVIDSAHLQSAASLIQGLLKIELKIADSGGQASSL